MKLKHHDLEIPKKDPFANCKLDRKQYALVLTDIVNTYADGFVLAINNEWGAGKTTFVKMLKQHLVDEGFETIYFNAWENDFDKNPLVALMSEMAVLAESTETEEVFKSVVEKGAVLMKNVAPAILKAIAKRYVDTDAIIDAIENTTEGVTEIFEDEIKLYANKKKTIVEFRKELEKFVDQANSDKPLVFMIDELDRCRPDYAVELLEQVKHFFSVPGIVFVLSIDKNHLSSSIKGVYGSEQINTEEYLRRFIDLEYSIPYPSIGNYCRYLYDYYSFDDFFKSERRKKIDVFRDDGNSFIQAANLIFTNSNATLRQQEKIFGQTRLVLSTFPANEYVFPFLIQVLVFLKTMKPEIFKKIVSASLSIQELIDEFSKLFPEMNDRSSPNLTYLVAQFAHFYNNQLDQSKRQELFTWDEKGIIVSSFTSKFNDKIISRISFAECLENAARNIDYSHAKLDHLLKKVNLTEPMILNT